MKFFCGTAALLCALALTGKAHAQQVTTSAGVLNPAPGSSYTAGSNGICPVSITTTQVYTYANLQVVGPSSGTFSWSMSIAGFKGNLSVTWSETANGFTSVSGSENVNIASGQPYGGTSAGVTKGASLYGTADYSAPQGSLSYTGKARANASGNYQDTGFPIFAESTFTINPTP